ncbi:unnamed protein product [Mytilus edulis]|uniref:Uncharacterized protein n=1 Tax=Mytilus edulis TaxID=6550 RepID=A0A8S3UJV2_MYTED|nr:unnamed protein product [Mytilus edulis]
MTISGVEEDNIELPVEILDEKKIFSLNNLPYSIKITEMEEQIKALIPLKNVMSLDCMFDRQKVMVHFSTFQKEQWEILERAASPIISESSELTQNDSTSVDYTTQSSQPCQSPKPSTSYESCVTAGSKKRPSMDGNDCPSNTNSGRKKRKSLQNSDEQVEDLLKEMVDKKEIEHFITTKILMAYPEYDVANNTQLIKETLQKVLGVPMVFAKSILHVHDVRYFK